VGNGLIRQKTRQSIRQVELNVAILDNISRSIIKGPAMKIVNPGLIPIVRWNYGIGKGDELGFVLEHWEIDVEGACFRPEFVSTASAGGIDCPKDHALGSKLLLKGFDGEQSLLSLRALGATKTKAIARASE
jgi:hypothetical protein